LFFEAQNAEYDPVRRECQTDLAISKYRQNALASSIWRGVRLCTWHKAGLFINSFTLVALVDPTRKMNRNRHKPAGEVYPILHDQGPTRPGS
jgi:hypothetical protein